MTRGKTSSAGIASTEVGLLIGAICCVVAAMAIALHSPGHMSMDTSMQLYEAKIGKSISWNPPFMSALMRWLGGGEIATACLVALTTGLIYAGFALTALAVVDQGRTVALWRAVLGVVVVLNPVVAVYAGIVWKDVVFAAFLCGGVGFGFAAGRGSQLRRWICAVVSAMLLAAAMLARQQGVFMAPLLLGVPILMLAGGSTGSRIRTRWVVLPIVFVCSSVLLQNATDATIEGNSGRSTSIGYRSIKIFDMMGIISKSSLRADELAYPVPAEIWTSVRKIYRASRIDTLDLDPAAGEWFGAMQPAEMSKAWKALVRQNPGAYLRHRADAYATLIGLHGLNDTLPVHIGVEGNTEMLEALGIKERRGPRDLVVYRLAVSVFDWPIYRHAFWIVMVAICCYALKRRRLPRQQRLATALVLLASALLYLAYIPTMIAADFRYLFGAIPLVSIAILPLLLGASSNRRIEPFSPEARARRNAEHLVGSPVAQRIDGDSRPVAGVAMCVYKGAPYLLEQLQSIAAQTELPSRMAIVDDCSPDGSWDLLQQWAASAPFEVRLHRNDLNLGVVRNFERAIEILGDDIEVVFLADQDDVWYPGKLAAFVDRFAADSALGLLHSDADLIDGSGKRLNRSLFETLLLSDDELTLVGAGRAWEVYAKRNLVTGAACAFRPSRVRSAFPFSPHWMHDEWLAFSASLVSKVGIMDRATMAYRLHDANVVGVPITSFGWQIRTTLDALTRPAAARQRARGLRLREVVTQAASAGCAPEVTSYLDTAATHAEFRGALPSRLRHRWPKVIDQWRAGYYHKWSNGDISMLHDLVFAS